MTRQSYRGSPLTSWLDKYSVEILLPSLLIIAAFGPYIAGPIRTEQVAGYGIGLLALFAISGLRAWTASLLIPWLWMIGVALVATFFTYSGVLPWDRGNLLAGFDNILQPVAVLLGIGLLVPARVAERALQLASKTVVWATTINAILAIASSVAPNILTPLLRPFWTAEASTVAESAMQMGRYSGIFNQPAEAGVVYSIAAVLAVWVYSHRAILMYGLVTILTVGGMFSVSKVFLLVGLPVTLGLLWFTRRGVARIWMVLLVFLLGLFIVSSTFIQDWAGYDYLVRLLEVPSDQSVIGFYTAGRWNEGSSMMTVIGSILEVSPLAGVGVAGVLAPYDSQWTEVFVMSGILGAIGVIAVLVVLIVRFVKLQEWNIRCTAIAFWIILTAGSFGISTLSANRVTTIVWVLIALFMALASRDASIARKNARKRV